MQAKWFITLPPEGAARQAGQETISAFETVLGKKRCASFDCGAYLSAFRGMLKTADETMAVDLLNQSMLVQCLAFEATHLLVLALSPVTLFTLNILKKQNIRTVHWFYEDFRRAAYWKDVLDGYNFFLAVQRGPVETECQRRNVGFSYVPTAAGKACAGIPSGTGGSRAVDVAFVGIPSSYRAEVLRALHDAGISLAVAGSGWNAYKGPLMSSIVRAEWTSETQARDILTSAKIGINLSTHSPSDDAQVSPRVFDVLAAGCILATEDTPLTRETLAGLHYLSFSGAQDAAQKIKAALANLGHEQAHCQENARIVCCDHRYLNRVKEIIAKAV